MEKRITDSWRINHRYERQNYAIINWLTRDTPIKSIGCRSLTKYERRQQGRYTRGSFESSRLNEENMIFDKMISSKVESSSFFIYIVVKPFRKKYFITARHSTLFIFR